MCCSIDFISLTRRLAYTLVARIGLIVGEYTHLDIVAEQTYVYICVCARFNIDVIKSQLDLIQQASPYQNRLLAFFPSLSLSLFLVLFSGSSTNIFFSLTHSLVSRWSSFNYIHSNKRE